MKRVSRFWVSLLLFSIRTIWVALSLALVSGLQSVAAGQTAPERVLQARYSGNVIPAASAGELQIGWAVKEGFKIAKNPAPRLQIKPLSQFDVAVGSFVEGSAGEDADYFGSLKPLLLKIVPVKALQRGKYRLEAKLTYFYCSELEKYCSRSIETLAIPIEVANK
ncbi:MAG: hypothetical protein FJW26_07160 [Acidimicrobiia bacterium]|nr:hypothetical protein [Acidimicrobiia bacterium]